MSNTVISVEHLTKYYDLGVVGTGTLARDLNRWWARIRHQPDPEAKVDRDSFFNSQDESILALDDVSFTVERGEVLGIIGRNGAGKSTLLKILSRVTAPTNGVVKVKGRIGSLLEVGTGFHPELTGRENLFLNGAILGMKKAEVQRKFDEIVDFSGVEKYIDTPVKRYSSGMYVRLGFAVAAHLDPEILIVDEVLAVGDIEFQKKCIGKMGQVAGEGRTVLFVSHNIGTILRLCPKGILLHHGQMIMNAFMEDTAKKYISMGSFHRAEYTQSAIPSKPINLRRIYLTSPNGNFQDEFKFTEGLDIHIEYEVNQPIKNSSVWLGVRTIDDVVAFGTSDTDTDLALWENREIGYYHTSVTLPGNWLNEGDYYVVVGINNGASKRGYDRVEAVEFTIIDDGTPARISAGSSRPGILHPFLKWNTDRQNIISGR